MNATVALRQWWEPYLSTGRVVSIRDSGAGFADFNYAQGKWLCLAIYQTFDASEVHYHTIPALSVTPYCLIFAFRRPFIACIEHKMNCYHHKSGFYCRQNSKKKRLLKYFNAKDDSIFNCHFVQSPVSVF